MTIVNGSFETRAGGSGPGVADGWTTSVTSSGEEFAEFDLDVSNSVATGQETFEGEWPAGFVGLVGEYAGYYVDLDPAVFASSPRPVEDFETEWGTGNQGPLSFQSLPTEVAVFDVAEPSGAEPVEDFEEGWPAGQTIVPSFTSSDLEFADFDAYDYEDFEGGWDNDSYVWSYPAGWGVYLSPAGFATGYGVSGNFETFEGEAFDFEVTSVAPATDTITKVGHGLATPWAVTLRNEGGRLPDGLFASTEYVVQNETADTFQLAAVNGGTIIDIGDVGYGTHYVKHDPGWFWTEELTGV